MKLSQSIIGGNNSRLLIACRPYRQNEKIDVSSNSEIGSVQEPVKADIQGKDIRIAMNSKFIIDAVNALSEEEIVLSFNNQIQPSTVIKSLGIIFSFLIKSPLYRREVNTVLSEATKKGLPVRNHGRRHLRNVAWRFPSCDGKGKSTVFHGRSWNSLSRENSERNWKNDSRKRRRNRNFRPARNDFSSFRQHFRIRRHVYFFAVDIEYYKAVFVVSYKNCLALYAGFL